MPTLGEQPDWRYLLQEFHELYRRGKAGGSTRIRSHQRAVHEAITRTLASDRPVIAREREDKPVTAHLKRALDQGRQAATASIVRAIESVLPERSWLYGYEKVPKGLVRKYAYAEFAGPRGRSRRTS